MDLKEIYLAGGCFWGVEKYFSLIKGVVETSVGYANGTYHQPAYQEVCRGEGNFAETVKVVYDSERVSLDFLLQMYYDIIDPTLLNRQGPDRGVQYRTGIYYTDPADEEIVRRSLMDLQSKFIETIQVEGESLKNYYRAEEYHQSYLDKNPGGYCHIGQDSFRRARQG